MQNIIFTSNQFYNEIFTIPIISIHQQMYSNIIPIKLSGRENGKKGV